MTTSHVIPWYHRLKLINLKTLKTILLINQKSKFVIDIRCVIYKIFVTSFLCVPFKTKLKNNKSNKLNIVKFLVLGSTRNVKFSMGPSDHLGFTF